MNKKYIPKVIFLSIVIIIIITLSGQVLKEKTPAAVETTQPSNYPQVNLFEKSTKVKIHTPEEFGANGFDSKPDTVALQKAINKSDIVILKSGAKYITYRALVSNHSIIIKSDNENLISPVILQMSKQSAFILENIPVLSTKVAKVISKNEPYVTLVDTKGLRQGDLLHLKSSKFWYWENRGYLKKGELHKIKKVAGNKVYLERNTSDDYLLSEGEEITVRAYPEVKLELTNITFAHPKPYKTTMLKINNASHTKIKNVTIKNSQEVGIYLNRTYETEVVDVEIDLGTTNNINTGYGIQDYGGTGTTITESIFRRVRRGVDFSGVTPSRFGVVSNSKAYGFEEGTLAGGNSGFGTHSTAENITFANNYVENFNYGFLSRGNNISIRDNSLEGFSRNFAAISYGGHVEILNNTYNSKSGSQLDSFLKLFDSYRGSIIVTGNTVNGINGPFINGNQEILESSKVIGNKVNN